MLDRVAVVGVCVLIVLSPFEAFNERFKLTFILGLSIALPVVIWQAWSFVVPGLLHKERKWVPWLAIGSMVLFATGAAAAYFYVVPLVVHVLEQFLVPGLTTQIRLQSLLDFTYNLALACGILMQLPLVTLLLTAIGLVSPMFLLRQWRIASLESLSLDCDRGQRRRVLPVRRRPRQGAQRGSGRCAGNS